jgi:MoaA/NifB/PqqE/SkfB family radical SAM enzyme
MQAETNNLLDSWSDSMPTYMEKKKANKSLNSQEIFAKATDLRSKPLRFWFDINGPCNLECTHCGFRAFGRTSDQEVSQEIYDTVCAELMPTAYTCNLGGTNWGEVTIAKKFHKFINDCKTYEVKVNLTTNGARMSKDWIYDLADVLEVIGFSMEGMGEQFEKIRGFKWQFFVKNIERICQVRSEKGHDFRIEWRYCAHADNVHQLPEMIRFARNIGVDRIQVMNLVPYVHEQKYKNLHFHRMTANHFFAEARKVADELNFDIEIPPDFETGTFKASPVKDERPAGRTFVRKETVELANCFLPWQACSINELGVVKPCCVYWKPMGSLRDRSFDAVWNGRRYRNLRASVNSRPDHICYTCRLPRFESEQNKSLSQLTPGLKEVIRQVTTIQLRDYKFEGVFGGSLAPEEAS